MFKRQVNRTEYTLLKNLLRYTRLSQYNTKRVKLQGSHRAAHRASTPLSWCLSLKLAHWRSPCRALAVLLLYPPAHRHRSCCWVRAVVRKMCFSEVVSTEIVCLKVFCITVADDAHIYRCFKAYMYLIS